MMSTFNMLGIRIKFFRVRKIGRDMTEEQESKLLEWLDDVIKKVES